MAYTPHVLEFARILRGYANHRAAASARARRCALQTKGGSLTGMPISAEHVGRRYPAAPPYVVSHAKIAEFAAAVGDDNPAYSGEAPIAPPTFAAVIAAQAWGALFADGDLGLALNRTMHTDQHFAFRRPLRPGDAVVAELSIEKVRTRGALELVTVLVDLLVDGETVCEARSTLMHTRPEEAGDE